MRYVPALDGLRALAVVTVVLHHTRVPGFHNGAFGVDLFFVLSGYLITQVLAENADLRRFYWRRFLRLVPPLTLMLAAFLAFYPGAKVRDAALAFFYLSDYSYALWRVPQPLGHTWSLSVEEHFYLLWPLVFLRWRPDWRMLVLAFLVFTAWRLAADWEFAKYRFDTRLAGLVLGCALARMPRPNISAGWGLAGLVLLGVLLPESSRQWGLTLVEVAAAVAVVGRHPAWLSRAPLVYLGKLSYGVYLWHYPIALLTLGGWWWELNTLVTLAASIALAALSYHTIEAWTRSARRGEGLPEVHVIDNAGSRSRAD